MVRPIMVLSLLLVSMATVAAKKEASTGKAQSVAPVQKVIQMLTDMQATARQAKKDEEVTFAQFTTWCSAETATLKGEIAKNTEEIELLDTEIMKLENDVKSLGEAIAKLDSHVASDEASKKQETGQRVQDNKDFLAEEKDYSESIDALDGAIKVLQEQNYDRPAAAAALLQITGSDSQIPAQAKSIVTAFLSMMGGDKSAEDADPLGGMDYAAPEANAYEFQSGRIVDLLKKLKDEFRAKLATCQKEEKNSLHAYNMIVLDLTDSIENARKDVAEKTQEKMRKTEKSALNKKQLASTKDLKAGNEKMLVTTTTECTEKNLSYQEKQNLRMEELEAIAKAIEILSSPEVLGNAETYLALAQKKPAMTALLQTAERGEGYAQRRHVREFLLSEGQRIHSQRIALLAEKLAVDPFAKVKQLIDSMITRLLEEANADADHEGFCDTEMGKSKITRNKLGEDIDGLSAAVEEGKATILALAESTDMLTKEVESLVTSMGEASDLRKAEKAKNAETVKDAKAAQTAVAAAMAILKDFYDKALTATGFLQISATPTPRKWGVKMGVKMGSEEWNALANPNYMGTETAGEAAGMGKVDTGHKEGMQTFGETEEGQQDEARYGVLALLEVVQSDFARLEADTIADEGASQKVFEAFMTESTKSKATKDRKIEMNNSDEAAAEAKLSTDIADLKATQDELLAADRYHAKLVPQCIDQGMPFAERTSAREEEIASLKKALQILSSEDIATSAL